MNKEQLHRYIAESTGNESNICQIYTIQDGKTVYDDCWRGFILMMRLMSIPLPRE